LQGLGIVSTLAASLYVTMMALYYAKILASGVELESEMKGHLATATELRRATAEAERAGAAKAEFLAKMSHELRTPLNAVIGYSQMLLEDARDEGDAESAEDLDKIHSAGHHLLRLVSEVLDLSKIEAGKMELTVETTDAADLVRTAVEPFGDAAAKRGDTLTLDLAADLGTVVCDGARVRQVLTQIVDNAIKFTQDGSIVVSARRVKLEGVEKLTVSVKDTGIGIAEEVLPILFENFSVGEDSSASKYGGTGLGLALSRKLSKLMGGDVFVESTLGSGSCFTVALPVSPPSAPARMADEETELAHVVAAEELAA
jgi:signal transduction histidine kinase